MGTVSSPSICTFDVSSIELNVVSFLNRLKASILTESHELVFPWCIDCLVDVLRLSGHVTLEPAHLFHRLIELSALIPICYILIIAYLFVNILLF